MRSSELADCALSIRNIAIHADDSWTTFEVIENGELERPLHHRENILEQVLDWGSLDDPGSAFLVIKTFQRTKMVSGDKDQMQFMKGDHLKFKDGSSKLLSGHKFQDKYVVLRADKLLLYRDYKSTKAEREVPLMSVKCYLGLRKKLKPPNSWGFTVYTDKHQWHFCCEEREAQLSWVTDIIRMKYGSDLWLESSDSGEAGAHRASRRASVSVGQGGPQGHKHITFNSPQTERSPSARPNPKPTKTAASTAATRRPPRRRPPRRRLTAAASRATVRAAPKRPRSVEVCLPLRRGVPAPAAMPVSVHNMPAAAHYAGLARCRRPEESPNRAAGASPGEMPPNVLNELKSVLSRAAGGAKAPRTRERERGKAGSK